MQEDYSKILWEAYNNFILKINNSEVPTPYRINVPFQEDRRRYGKSNPEQLVTNLKEIAQEVNFDLENSSKEEIERFMKDQMLGVDCSGFVYHMLDYLLKRLNKGGMETIGFPYASQTNVTKLADEQFSYSIEAKDLQPGDIIIMNSEGEVKHVMIVLDKEDDQYTYAHSSEPIGVHTAKLEVIDNQIKFLEDLGERRYNPTSGDGPRRLKALS